eukprot:3486911-Rhodomonas_salina.2
MSLLPDGSPPSFPLFLPHDPFFLPPLLLLFPLSSASIAGASLGAARYARQHPVRAALSRSLVPVYPSHDRPGTSLPESLVQASERSVTRRDRRDRDRDRDIDRGSKPDQGRLCVWMMRECVEE